MLLESSGIVGDTPLTWTFLFVPIESKSRVVWDCNLNGW